MAGGEEDFAEHAGELQEAVHAALSGLTEVRAYTLTADELRDFKAAQYALRNMSDSHTDDHDVSELYE